MHIVHVTDYFQPALGYQEFFLARAHRALGHRVTVVTSDRYFPFPAYHQTVGPVLGARQRGAGRGEELGVDVVRLPTFELAARPVVWLRGLAATLAELAPDVVFGHELLSTTTWQLARARARQNFKLVVDNHACDFNTALEDSLPKRLYVGLYRAAVLPALLGQAAAVVAIGPGEQELACRITGLAPARVPVIALGADTAHFRPRPDEREAARRELGLAPRSVVIVHAGKLTPEKDVHVLVGAVRALVEAGQPLQLLMVGGGPPEYLEWLEAEAGVQRSGWLIQRDMMTNADLARALGAADLGAWPGNFSQVIVEAMAAGLPLVLPAEFSRGYPSAHLLAAENGVRFPRGDRAALVTALSALAADPATRTAMAARSRRLAEERFSWTGVAQAFLAAAGCAP